MVHLVSSRPGQRAARAGLRELGAAAAWLRMAWYLERERDDQMAVVSHGGDRWKGRALGAPVGTVLSPDMACGPRTDTFLC